ncbi:UNVERIFIED_CONTAM: ABC-type multidrug transport system fused ATPase/permease subunit [Acetivibrio alkalicellulosi]
MKDKKVLQWIYENSKSQIVPMCILVFANIIAAVSGVFIALASRGLIDNAAAGYKNGLFMYGALLLFLVLFQLGLNMYCKYTGQNIQNKLENCYKTSVLGKFVQKEYSHMQQYHKGDVMSRITSDILKVSENVATVIPDSVKLLTKLFSVFTVLFILNRVFTVIFLVVGTVVFFVSRLLRNKVKELHKNVQQKDGMLQSFIYELLENIIVVKVFRIEKTMLSKSKDLQQQHYDAKRHKNIFTMLSSAGFSFVFAICYIYALVWNSFELMENNISFGTLTAMLQLVSQLQLPFSGLSGLMPKVYGAMASAERIIELEELLDESDINKKDDKNNKEFFDIDFIAFEKVSFTYGEKLVLSNVNLIVAKGDFALLRGVSGIGKSTLLKLLLRIYPAKEGEIYLKTTKGTKIDVDCYTRKYFAYVPQKNILISGTVRDNISFFNKDATDEQIMRAAQISCADLFISMLPLKLDTIIGEKGQGLSEGQIQRIAIARAVLSDAPILLLDEATSALDESTEKKVLLNLKKHVNRTFIIISHKNTLSSLYNKVFYLKDGKIFEERRSFCEC